MRTAATLRAYLSRRDTMLPDRMDFERAADAILFLYDANKGATFSLFFGNQAGQRLYAVSVFPERSAVLQGRETTRQMLMDFMEANADLLQDPRCCVGIWYDIESDETYLDVSVALPNKQVVIALGRQYNQIGIFDLFRTDYIETGGTGLPVEEMPPEMSRLPAIRRKNS